MSAPAISWVLQEQDQRCVWISPTHIPEVDISIATVLDIFPTKDLVFDAATKYLSQLGGRMEFSDVRPIEKCACCGTDFDTNIRHKVLTVSAELNPETDPTVLDIWYVARFCINCVPMPVAYNG